MKLAKQFSVLAGFLSDADRLRRKSEVAIWIPRMLNLALIASVILGIIIRLWPIMDEKGFVTLVTVLILTGSSVAAVIVFTRTRTLIDKAKYADKKLSLQERASTSVEIHLGVLSVVPELKVKQLANTIDSTSGINLNRAIPLKMNRKELAIILLMMALLVVNIIVPNPQYDVLRNQKELARSITEQISSLEGMWEEIANDNQLDEESKELILAPIGDAIESIREGQISREEALAILSQAEKELRELGTSFEPALNQSALAEAGEALSSAPAAAEFGAALQRGDVAEAAQAVNFLIEELSDLDGETRSNLAEDLASAAAILRDTDQDFANLISDAARAIQAEDDQLAQELLADLAIEFEDAARQELAADVAESTAEQIASAGQEVAGLTQAGSQDSGQSVRNLLEGASGQASDGSDDQAAGISPDSNSDMQQGPGSPGQGGGRADSVFTPDLVDLGTQPGVPVELPANCEGDVEDCGLLLNESAVDFGDEASVIPYTEVFAEYRDSAYQALEREQIPLRMKDYIRDYFTSLEP